MEVDYKMVYKKEIILVVERISELCKTFSFELDNLIKIGNYDNFIIESLNDYSDAFKDESNYIHNSILKKIDLRKIEKIVKTLIDNFQTFFYDYSFYNKEKIYIDELNSLCKKITHWVEELNL